MSVLTILLVLLLSMVDGSTKLWKTNENRVDSYREARAAINLIKSDLASIYTSTNTDYFYTEKDQKPDVPVKVSGMDGSIFFMPALPKDAQESTKNKSDLCTVGYYLGFDKTSLTGKGTKSYNLYRYFRSSDDTYTSLANNNFMSGVTTDTSQTSANSEVLAKNIVGFTVTPYEIPFDPSNPTSSRTPIPFTKTTSTPLPDMIEISITAISNDAAKRFGDDKTKWEDPNSITRKQEGRTFTTRIYLPGAAGVKSSALPTPTPSPSPTP
jgi:hypothetical protein